MVEMRESELVFEFPDDSVFFPEREKTLRTVQHVKLCDAIYRTKTREGKPLVNLIEVKSSFPDFTNPESKKKLADNIAYINQKFVNSLLLYLRCRGGVFNVNLPLHLQDHDALACEYRFILIVRGHASDWNIPIMDALNIAQRDVLRSFKLMQTRVVNEHDAALLKITIRN